jgi:regulator of sigma D
MRWLTTRHSLLIRWRDAWNCSATKESYTKVNLIADDEERNIFDDVNTGFSDL